MPQRRRRHVMTHYELIKSLKATPIAEGIHLTFKPARKALFVPSQWTPRLVGPSFKCRTEPFWSVDNKKVSYQNPAASTVVVSGCLVTNTFLAVTS